MIFKTTFCIFNKSTKIRGLVRPFNGLGLSPSNKLLHTNASVLLRDRTTALSQRQEDIQLIAFVPPLSCRIMTLPFSFAPYNLFMIVSRNRTAPYEFIRKQRATIIGKPYCVCQMPLEVSFFCWTSDTKNKPSLYIDLNSMEFRGGDMKHINQFTLNHPQVLQVGRNGKLSISVHSDYSSFHAIPPIVGKCPLIRFSKTDMSCSNLVLVTLAYICVVVMFV